MSGCCDNPFSAAALKRRITFESLSLTPNGTGGQLQSYTLYKTVWASITPKITSERNFAQRIEPLTSHEIGMRYVPGINSKMRIVYGDRIFEIKSVINVDEESEFLRILAMERTGT